VGVLLAELLHSGLQCASHVPCFNVILVELLHECGGALVVNVPEGEEQSRRARAEQATLQAQEFVPRGNEVHAGGATAESDKSSRQANLVEVV